jgi:oligoendopeptidase F
MVNELLGEKSARVFDGKRARRVPFNGLPELLSSSNPRVVTEAGNAMTRIMRTLAPIAEREINAIVTTNLRLSQIRHYDRPDAGRFQRDDLDAKVAEAMMATAEGGYPLAHRFYALKARLLGKETFTYPERVAAYGQLPDGYNFEQGAELLRGVLTKLHPDFAREFERALASGHIDALPRAGKLGSAACWRSLIGQPTYLLLNFMGQVRDIQTLGHEFGHYLNNMYMQKAGLCNSLTFGATTPMAEGVGNFFEKYVLDAIAAEADAETQLALMVADLDRETASIFRQTAAMRFEQELYAQIEQEGYLSHQRIGEIFRHHMSAYLGNAVTVDEAAGLWWIHWNHFRADFYVYGYTFAMMVAKALQVRHAADPAYIDEFRRLLSTGKAEKSRDLLASMGLDIAEQQIWQTSLDAFGSKLDAVEALARELGKL